MVTINLLTLSEAARKCPGHVSSATVWRWIREGLKTRTGKKVYLEHRRVGRKILTSLFWLDEFFKAVATEDQKYFEKKNVSTKHQSEKRRTQIKDAYHELDENGV